MNWIRRIMERLIPNEMPLPPGIYHTQAAMDAPIPHRMHLRLEQDGSGILVLDASIVLHLNQTAAEYVFHLIQHTTEEEMLKQVTRRYKVSQEQAKQDYQDLLQRLNTLLTTTDLDPEMVLGFDRVDPYSQALQAPLRLDCALTYQVDDADASAAPVERVKSELSTEDWQRILDKSWEAGVPHVIFTGGEPTLREDLPALIAHAEQLGMVSGVLTNGLHLIDPAYRQSLLVAGLDHLMLLLDPNNPRSWLALDAVLSEDVFVTTHLTLQESNRDFIGQQLTRLEQAGVKSLSLSAAGEQFAVGLTQAREIAAALKFSLVWDIPVPYSGFHPVALELAEEGTSATKPASAAWLYVEPDGDVLPSQGVLIVLGNLVSDPFMKVWKESQK